MRTQGAYYGDTPHLGGFAFYDAFELSPVLLAGAQSTNFALTRNALGDYSMNRTAAGAETYQCVTGVINMKRLVESLVQSSDLPFQNQFGTSTGTTSYVAGAAGIPPFSGNTQLTQPTAQPSKGLMVTDVVAVYQVGVASLTSASLSLNRTTFANNVANSIVNVPVAATALPLTSQANPYVVTRAVTTPAFEVTDLSDLSLELAFVMANTGTMRIYGIGFHYTFNMN